MGVVGDASRVSKVVADQPYMGLGKDWPVPTTSWSELNYTNMCINACWELYGANDRAHLPGSGSQYDIQIVQPNVGTFPWVTKWDEDEGSQKPAIGCLKTPLTKQLLAHQLSETPEIVSPCSVG